MHLLKTAIQVLKTTLKFIWRHAFTLYISLLIIAACIETHSINIKNVIFLIVGASLIDWIKMKIALRSSYNLACDQRIANARWDIINMMKIKKYKEL